MKTRTIKELLILLRDFLPTNIHNEVREGGCLCYSITDMVSDDIITGEECGILSGFIERHKPKGIKIHNVGYWWKYRMLAPRMRFLNKLISEL